MKCTFFFAEYKTFLFWLWVFSRALGWGSRRGHACTPWRKCRPRPGSVARALGAQSREMWQVITGSLSAELEPTRRRGTPQIVTFSSHFSFFHLSLLVFPKYHNSRIRLGSHDTTAALQAFHFVTDTNGAFACGFVSVRVCECHRQILQRQEPRTNSLENRGAIHLFGSFSCLLCSLPLLCARITP